MDAIWDGHKRQAWAVMAQLDQLDARRWTPGRDWTDKADDCVKAILDIEELTTYRSDYMGRDPVDKKPKEVKATWVAFKNIPLSEAQLDAFDHWDTHDEDVWILVTDVIQAGYKLSITYNAGNDTFSASLTGPGGGDKRQHFTVSAFAETWYEATRMLMYKHHVICEGDWSKAEETGGRRRG